jgi:tetrahydromethanopterin S-methyltransferase subunit G
MGVVEETRQVVQDFLAPELREIRAGLSNIDKRLDSMEEVSRARYESIVQRIETMDKRLDSQDKRLEFHEEAIRARFDIVAQRLETVQQSFAFDKRISSLEEDKRRSA